MSGEVSTQASPGQPARASVAGDKVILVGNCQAVFLAEALGRAFPGRRDEFECRQIASPLVYLSHPGSVPPELQARFVDPSTAAFLERTLENQFEIIAATEPPPRAIIFSIFHEASPLYEHKTDKYVFHILETVHRHRPDLSQWIHDNFNPIKPDPLGYFARYSQLLDALRRRLPETRFLILKRASHLRAYGPTPFSYIAKWDDLELEWKDWISSRADISVLEMDRICAGLFHETGDGPGALFPFLRQRPHYHFKKYRRHIGRPMVPFAISRDVEHGSPAVWERLSRHVDHWLEAGEINYSPHETMPANPTLFQPRKIPRPVDRAELKTENPYRWANELEYMVWNPRRADWAKLNSVAEHFPLNQLLLRSLRAYLDLYPTSPAIPFLERHRQTAAQSDREPFWKIQYLETVQKSIDELVKRGGRRR